MVAFQRTILSLSSFLCNPPVRSKSHHYAIGCHVESYRILALSGSINLDVVIFLAFLCVSSTGRTFFIFLCTLNDANAEIIQDVVFFCLIVVFKRNDAVFATEIGVVSSSSSTGLAPSFPWFARRLLAIRPLIVSADAAVLLLPLLLLPTPFIDFAIACRLDLTEFYRVCRP